MEYSDIKKLVESCHLNFLIGSGASKPFLETLNQIEGLLVGLNNDSELDSNNKIILETSIKHHYFEKCIKGNLELFSGKSTDLVSTKNNYSNWVNSLFRIISKRRSNLVSKQINLFTSNMDIFIDWALEENQCSVNDGFFGRMNPIFGTQNFHNVIRKTSSHYEYQSEVPLFNLFKLHGSVNWKQNGESICFDNRLSTLKNVAETIIADSDLLAINNTDENFSKLKQDISVKGIIKKDSHDKFLEAFNELVMINPSKQKFETTTRDLTFYELLRMYSNHLEREHSVLFVIGFSFTDEHIREITKRVAMSNPTLLIVIFAYDKKAKDEIQSNLPFRANIKYMCRDDEDVSIKFALNEINNLYFEKIANELENSKPDTSEIKIVSSPDVTKP